MPSLIKRRNTWPLFRRQIRHVNPRDNVKLDLLAFDAVQVQDALVILRISMNMVIELRRKYGIDIVPSSEKSSGLRLTLEQVVRYLLNEVQPQSHRTTGNRHRLVTAKDQDPPSVIVEALDLIGIPKCHQTFVETFIEMPDLKYFSFIILMSLFFNPAPQPPYTA